jgi:hypothetical protein
MPSPSLRPAAALLLGAALLAGCGKSLPAEGHGRGASVTTVAGTSQLAASGLATRNTTRLGGADPVADAAAVALATYPGLTPATRPQAVVLVDDRDWPGALAASALASAPLRAPILYSEGSSLPTLSAQALATLKPTGAARLGGAQVIEVGAATAPTGYRTLALSGRPTASAGVAPGSKPTGTTGRTSGRTSGEGSTAKEAGGSGPAAVAAQVERLVAILHGGHPHRVIVVGADGPPALAMPAAGLAAESGVPILPVNAAAIPPATRRVLVHLHRPAIYAVGPPSAVSHTVLAKLMRFGAVRRIYPTPGANGASGPGTSGEDPADNAIAVTRFSDGTFGWGVDQPGHGLVFANASRPLDAPAAAPLSASGDYAPLLLLERPNQVPPVLSEYLGDIRPGYSEAPESEYPAVRGAYNRGWLLGDEAAITPTVQAELDSMLEITPQSSTSSTTPATPTSTEPSTSTETTASTPSATTP